MDLLLGLGCVAVGLILRGSYLGHLTDIPLFDHLLVDALSYDRWAARIAAGEWWGDEVFYQAPAYPYFLALVYRMAGHDVWWAHVVQLALGALSCGVLYAATRLLFDRASGLVAGLLCAIYPPALFFDGLIQKASLAFFLTCGLLVAMAIFRRRRRMGTRGGIAAAASGGIVFALLCLTRENVLVFLAVLPTWMFLATPGSRRNRLGGPLVFCAAAFLVLGAVGARNWSVGGTFAITTSQAGTNFYIGNHAGAIGTYVPLLPGRETPATEGPDAAAIAERALGRPLTPGEVSGYWTGQALDFIQREPAHWAALLAWKGLLSVNRFEVPDTEDILVYADFSPLLRALLPVLHLGVLLPLAAAGVVLGWRERASVGLLVALFAAHAGSVTLFYVSARYRFPLVAFALPLAGVAIVAGWRAVARHDLSALAAPAGAALLTAAVANLPLLDANAYRMISYMNLGVSQLQTGELAEAERFLLRAREYGAHVNLEIQLGVLRLRQDRLAEARRHAQRARELAPRDPRAHELMARIFGREGDLENAHRSRHEARRLADEAPRRE